MAARTFLLLFSFVVICKARVLELDDRFREARSSGTWLVMFYAPWCGHCKQLEPTWMEVGAALYEESPVSVARLDCTRFSSLAEQFGIRGFPTIKFITAEHQYEYRGPRTKESIIEFSEKARKPPITSLTSPHEIEPLKKSHAAFFLYIGEKDGHFWELYEGVAAELFLSMSFYAVSGPVPDASYSEPTVLVCKGNGMFEYPSPGDVSTLPQLRQWVTSEQLPDFNLLTGAAYGSLKNTGKSFVIAVVKHDSEDLFTIVKQLALSRDKVLHPRFVFCWVKGNDIVNSMTYSTIPVPSVLVFNPTSYEYNMMNEEGVPLAHDNTKTSHVTAFLLDVIDGKAISYGGSGFFQQVKRFGSDSVRTLVNFFKDSPIVASFVIGTPTFVISLVCYCLCTLDDQEADGYPTDSEDEGEYDQLPEYEGEVTGDVRRRKVQKDTEPDQEEKIG